MATRCHVSRDIHAAPETVWALLSDAKTWTVWNPTVVSLDGIIAEGNTVRLVTTLDPKRTFNLVVDTLEAPNLMVWTDGMPLGLFTGTRTYRVAPTEGGSRFEMTEEFTGPMSGLITRFIPDMTEAFGQFADGLKAASER